MTFKHSALFSFDIKALLLLIFFNTLSQSINPYTLIIQLSNVCSYDLISLNEYAFDDLSNDVMRVSSYVQGAGNIGADYVLYKQGLALN